MRPRNEKITTALFAKREDVLAAMEQDIASVIGNGLAKADEIERFTEKNYAASVDGRFTWKIEERNIRKES